MAVDYDIAIIGAGVIGTGVARELSRYEIRVAIIDGEADVSEGTTKANTAIVHAGFDAVPGTCKARLNVRGNALMPKVCHDLSVPFEQKGSLVIALTEDQLPMLHELKDRGDRNGVPGVQILSRDEALELEPNLNPAIAAALFAPTGGIVNPWELAIAQAENAVENGVDLFLNERVSAIHEMESGWTVSTSTLVITARYVVNAAGCWGDEIARMIGQSDFTIIPRKGEYYLYDRRAGRTTTRPVFRVPTKISKGVVVTPTVDGNLLVGPNAHDVPHKDDTSTTWPGLSDVLNEARSMIPCLPVHLSIANFAGLRAVARPNDDFIIGPAPGKPSFVNAVGMQSPGLTASPAVAQEVRDLLQQAGLVLKPKKEFNPLRPRPKRFAELSHAERAAMMEQDHRHGHIICRCETVTEAEVVEALHRPVPCTTLDGVKRRTRAGTGRCQGGFCAPRVIAIISRELGIPMTEITKRGRGSEILLGTTKAPEAKTSCPGGGCCE